MCPICLGCPGNCNGHGTCTTTYQLAWECLCETGWYGAGCQIQLELNCDDKTDNDKGENCDDKMDNDKGENCDEKTDNDKGENCDDKTDNDKDENRT